MILLPFTLCYVFYVSGALGIFKKSPTSYLYKEAAKELQSEIFIINI